MKKRNIECIRNETLLFQFQIRDFLFRRACRADIQSIRLIERYSFSPRFYRTPKYLKHQIDVGRFCVCCYEQTVVGYIGFQVHKRFAVISEIAVRIDFRRRGVGKFLLNTLLNEFLFHKFQFREIRLVVAEKNEPALALYRSFLFECNKKLEGYYGDDDGIMMKKKNLNTNFAKNTSKLI